MPHPVTSARTSGDAAETSVALARVAARATPLHERLRRAPRGGGARPENDARAEALLASWRGACAHGDDGAFRTRLAWDGWDDERVRAAIAPEAAADGPLPPWAEFFAR